MSASENIGNLTFERLDVTPTVTIDDWLGTARDEFKLKELGDLILNLSDRELEERICLADDPVTAFMDASELRDSYQALLERQQAGTDVMSAIHARLMVVLKRIADRLPDDFGDGEAAS